MSDTTLYRVALEYEVAETFAERVKPDYVDAVDTNSLADDRFLIAEPDIYKTEEDREGSPSRMPA
jgi:hypothetical protein